MTRRDAVTKDDPVAEFVVTAERASLDEEKLQQNLARFLKPERLPEPESPLSDDDIEAVVNEMLRALHRSRPSVAKDLDSTWEWRGVFAGVVSGMLMGAWIGAQIGIATAGFGMPATIPVGVLVGVIGGFTGREVGRHVKRKDEDTVRLLLGPGCVPSKQIGSSQRLLGSGRTD